jgi:hypothetical protein
MIVVIQCAAKKRPYAGRFRAADGRPVLFVGDPLSAPASECLYARPDDPSDRGPSWRELLVRYNERPSENPFDLLPAFDLYENETYRRLVDRFGIDKTYILSAGWGLIKSTFLTPDYNITFTPQADPYKRRRRTDRYQDLCMLPADTAEPMFFFGSKEYVLLFAALTKPISVQKTVFHYSARPPAEAGCVARRFKSTNPRAGS